LGWAGCSSITSTSGSCLTGSETDCSGGGTGFLAKARSVRSMFALRRAFWRLAICASVRGLFAFGAGAGGGATSVVSSSGVSSCGLGSSVG
jgi:hypothetical protein